jgi:hypothetical protein
MDRATRKGGGIVAGIDARGCGGEDWSRMLRSYALGMIGETHSDYRRATEHIAGASCRRYAVGLRRVAALVPPFLIPSGLRPSRALALLHRIFAKARGRESHIGRITPPPAGLDRQRLSTVPPACRRLRSARACDARARERRNHHEPSRRRARPLPSRKSSASSRAESGAAHHGHQPA